MSLLLRPQLVMHWLVMHALAKNSPGWPGDVSVTDLPCVHTIYMEDHHRQTTEEADGFCVHICKLSAIESYYNVQRNAIIMCSKESSKRLPNG